MKKLYTLKKLMTLRDISDVRVSPAGDRLVFVVRSAIMGTEISEYRTHIHLVQTDGNNLLKLTAGEKSCYDPRWSPDGKWISFISSKSGKSNIWVTSPDGDDYFQITDSDTPVCSYKWSPDGNCIVYTAIDPEEVSENKEIRENNDVYIPDENLKTHQMYLVPVNSSKPVLQKARKLTNFDYTVGMAGMSGLFDWSPDSAEIAFTHTSTLRFEDWLTSSISIINLKTKVVEQMVRSANSVFEPIFSPDGKFIVYGESEPPHFGNDFGFRILNLSTGNIFPLANTIDFRPHIVDWSADNKKIYFTEWHGTTERFYILPIDDEAEAISKKEGVIKYVGIDNQNRLTGFVYQACDTPPEVYVSSPDTWNPKPVTRLNESLKDYHTGNTEVISWFSTDGLEIEGMLTLPVGYEKGKQYPLILSIHGGPTSLFDQRFIGSPSIYGPLAVFAAEGYAILRCNVRGSTGYGKKFRQSNYQDWGGMDFHDLMSGVDHITALSIVDPDKMGVMGWSYGGFLTATVITKTQRFKAAVIGAGITNLLSNAGTCDVPHDIPVNFGCEIWENPELFVKHSPLFQVNKVTTPTLILHGENDKRVHVTQAYEFHNALNRRGNAKVKLVVYPRMPHTPTEPKQMLDVMKRTLNWFNDIVKN